MARTLIYTAGDPNSHKEFGKEMQKLPPGEYACVIKKNRPIRSISANRYYHFCLNYIGVSTGHSHEELHEACKMKFNCTVIYFPKGGSQVVGKTTGDLDSAEFTAYVNRVKQWAQDEFGVVIPEARDVDYAKWIDMENSYNETQSGY